MNRLVAVCATAALLAGGLRMAAAVIPHVPDSASLETLYAAIDIGFLLGLLALYLGSAERLGTAGLVLFLVALVAIASIIGPDSQSFGVDFYRLGAGIFSLALALLSLRLLQVRVHVIPALLWIGSALLGIMSMLAPGPWFATAGIALGAGYLVMGLQLLSGNRTPLTIAAAELPGE